MSRQKTGLPKGTRDLLPSDLVPRQAAVDTLVTTFQRFGFEPLETPAFERIDTLTGKYGEEGDQLIFKILKRGAKAASGEADLALRYDLTVPLARVVAMYPQLPRPFKRYQVQPVWRADKPQKGRYREFTQCDVDVVGSTSPLVEVELLSMVDGVFRALGFTDHRVRVNHRQVLSGLIRASGVPEALEVTAIVAIDKLDKIGEEGVRAELSQREVPQGAIDTLMPSLGLSGAPQALLTELSGRLKGDEQGLAGVQNLRDIFEGLEAAGAADRVALDPFLARGLSYYTGAVFETVLEGLGSSVGGGGRYDELIGMFLGRPVPACGTSFGLDRILLVMEERGMLAGARSAVDVLITLYSDDQRAAALGLATELRTAGLRVDLYPEGGRLGQQFKYADQKGIRLAAVLGPDEIVAGTVTLKDLATREQSTVSRGEAAASVRAALGRPAARQG